MHRKRLTMHQRRGCGSEACRDERALAKGCRGELIVPARAATAYRSGGLQPDMPANAKR